MMTERALPVDAREAKGLHDGSVTCLVRVVDPQPIIRDGRVRAWRDDYDMPDLGEPEGEFRVRAKRLCPFGVVGDRLWLAEPWGVGSRPCPNRGWYDGIEYAFEQGALDEHEMLPCREVDVPADVDLDDFKGQWNSAATMPRWASSLILDVADVRVVQAEDVSEEEAKATGLLPLYWPCVHEGTGDHLGDQPSFALALRKLYTDLTQRHNSWLWLVTVAKADNKPLAGNKGKR